MDNLKIINIQKELINLYEQQIMDLTLMSKIELGDDVISKILELKNSLNTLEMTSTPSILPLPPKDRNFKEPSWLEILTFGLYKTKKYHDRTNT